MDNRKNGEWKGGATHTPRYVAWRRRNNEWIACGSADTESAAERYGGEIVLRYGERPAERLPEDDAPPSYYKFPEGAQDE